MSVVSLSGAARLAVADQLACRFTHDAAGVAPRSTFGSMLSWGGFTTRVPAAVTLCLMRCPPLRRFVLFNVRKL